jgi:hypothetical protein
MCKDGISNFVFTTFLLGATVLCQFILVQMYVNIYQLEVIGLRSERGQIVLPCTALQVISARPRLLTSLRPPILLSATPHAWPALTPYVHD